MGLAEHQAKHQIRWMRSQEDGLVSWHLGHSLAGCLQFPLSSGGHRLLVLLCITFRGERDHALETIGPVCCS